MILVATLASSDLDPGLPQISCRQASRDSVASGDDHQEIYNSAERYLGFDVRWSASERLYPGWGMGVALVRGIRDVTKTS